MSFDREQAVARAEQIVGKAESGRVHSLGDPSQLAENEARDVLALSALLAAAEETLREADMALNWDEKRIEPTADVPTYEIALRVARESVADMLADLSSGLPEKTPLRAIHVYCGNSTRYRGMFEEPEECSWEGDVPLPYDPADWPSAQWVCEGCGLTNNITDHTSGLPVQEPTPDPRRRFTERFEP